MDSNTFINGLKKVAAIYNMKPPIKAQVKPKLPEKVRSYLRPKKEYKLGKRSW